ncbi:hypothetical protein [Actinophytocola sp.]|uniref:hypothetical protein n=1 Tax=Actinophytocola sp. TaxID=1872138 RepID=UPI002D5FC1C7|nr:hypothetical protein [Actinophytocola sp.]HYQ62436.1 hypothetical protein [Actinophytocola sp.]
MSEEKAKGADEPPAGPKPSSAEPATPPTRDEAVNKLRHGDAAEQSKRVEQIIAEAISRTSGVTHVNLFSGDFTVAGDFTSGPGTRTGAARRSAKIRRDPGEFVAEYERYVPPLDFESGVERLDLHHLLVIADRARTGRDARAHATMVEVLRRNNMAPAFIELSGAALGNMAWQPPQRESAYLVRDLPGPSGRCAAESLDEKWLAHAAEQARAHGSYLVIVTGPVRGSLATATNRSDFVITDLDLPAPGEVMRRWSLAEHGWLTEAELDERLTGTGLDELLDERGDPYFAVRAAKAIGEALRTGAELSTVVARFRDPEERVREWLGADPDAADIALALATAALEGCGYLSVSDAAVSLYRRLGGSGTAKAPRYLRGLLAERSWIEVVQPDDGPRVVHFRQAGLRAAVLALTWYELDGAREQILGWLDELAHHPDLEVRTRAATTAGLLAARDLQHGLHHFFLPWAANNSPILRQSAATGLNVAGSVSGRPDQFWRYVELWAEQVRYDDEPALPATAATAAGGALGVADPARALRVFHTLVDEGGWDLLEPVAVSTHQLLAAGRAGPVIEALLEWTDGRLTDDPMVKALTVFAFVAGEEGPAGTPAHDRPVLMHSMADLRDELPELWGRALDCEPVRDMAAEALRSWVRATDRDPALTEDVLDLLAGIADRGDQDYRRLCHLLDKWAEDQDEPSSSARHFHSELVEEGELVS